MTETISFYDRNAERFAADTASVDMSSLYQRFVHSLPPGGRILDAGCGVGRDALAFADQGFVVLAFDASAEMVRLARERVGGVAEVRQMRFEDVDWKNEFDGIWACASLLHVAAEQLPKIIARLAATLRSNGVFYMSFKHGKGQRVAGGRYFADHTVESLRAALGEAGLDLSEVWITADVRAGRSSERWLNAIVSPRVDHETTTNSIASSLGPSPIPPARF